MKKDALFAIALSGCLAMACAPFDQNAVRAMPRAGQVFSECPGCPRMVVIPGGSFLIGSPETELDRYSNEAPQRRVSIATFAVSETEITVEQYRVFADETNRTQANGCHTHGNGVDIAPGMDLSASWRAPGFQQSADHPVVCVSWQDARDYVSWLGRKTGRNYRLLSEAEWEYSVRAGAATAYFWGENVDQGCALMNGGDQSLARALPVWSDAIDQARHDGEFRARLVQCDDGSVFTSPAGQYEANAFGLRDMIGNAWEWVEDCWNEAGYEALAADGRSQVEDGCALQRIRGGSWNDWPEGLRSARRSSGLAPTLRKNDTGFRVASDAAN